MIYDNILFDENIVGAEKIIFAIIVSMARSNQGKSCYLRNEGFVKRTGLSMRTIKYKINNLKKKEYIYITGKGRSRAIHVKNPAIFAEYGRPNTAKSAINTARNVDKHRKIMATESKYSVKNTVKADDPPSAVGSLPKSYKKEPNKWDPNYANWLASEKGLEVANKYAEKWRDQK